MKSVVHPLPAKNRSLCLASDVTAVCSYLLVASQAVFVPVCRDSCLARAIHAKTGEYLLC